MTPVWMIRPHAFGANPETAKTNAFQVGSPEQDVAGLARAEFDGLAAALRSAGVTVAVTEDAAQPVTPDAVFPNNWVSFHEDGTVVIYPMLAPNRQREVQPHLVREMAERHRFHIARTLDLRPRGGILEGTGSLVLDRPNRVAYACKSPRTDIVVAEWWADQLGYSLVPFRAVDARGMAVYHTNVMMSVDPSFAVVCSDAVPDAAERENVVRELRKTGRIVIEIDFDQMESMAGNILGLDGAIAMSSRAYASFSERQRAALETVAPLVHAPLDTIETHGGGSARCMLAAVHLPPV